MSSSTKEVCDDRRALIVHADPPEVEELVRRESRAGRSNEVLVHQDTRESRSNEELVRRESRAGRSNEVLVHQVTREGRSNEVLIRRGSRAGRSNKARPPWCD